MAYDKLTIYNNALVSYLGEGALSGLAEKRGPRFLLDGVWDQDPIKYALEQGEWGFAISSVKMVADPGIEPPFGFRYAFEKPADWRRMAALCYDEYFKTNCNDYSEEGNFIYANTDVLYARFVSDDDTLGRDYSKWTASFFEYLCAFMAWKIVHRVKNSRASRDELSGMMQKLLIEARGFNALSRPAAFMQRGSWARARGGLTPNNTRR